jgi:hypothetical protein
MYTWMHGKAFTFHSIAYQQRIHAGVHEGVPAWRGDEGNMLDEFERIEARGCTFVLPIGAAEFSTSSTAVSRLKDGLRGTAEVDRASRAATAARTWVVLLSVAAKGMLGTIAIPWRSTIELVLRTVHGTRLTRPRRQTEHLPSLRLLGFAAVACSGHGAMTWRCLT